MLDASHNMKQGSSVMIGSVGNSPLASQLQAYSGVKPGEDRQPQNERIQSSSERDETQEASSLSTRRDPSETAKADSAERPYDSGGAAARNEQRGMLLDVSA